MPVARPKIKKGRRVIRSPLYTSNDSPLRGSYSHNQTRIISSTVTLSSESNGRRPYYAESDVEKQEVPLTQQDRPSRQDTIDVYSSQSDLSYPISFDESDSSKKSDVDRRSCARPSTSYKV